MEIAKIVKECSRQLTYEQQQEGMKRLEKKLGFAGMMALDLNLYRLRIGHPLLLELSDEWVHMKKEEKKNLKSELQRRRLRQAGFISI